MVAEYIANWIENRDDDFKQVEGSVTWRKSGATGGGRIEQSVTTGRSVPEYGFSTILAAIADVENK